MSICHARTCAVWAAESTKLIVLSTLGGCRRRHSQRRFIPTLLDVGARVHATARQFDP